MSTTVVMPPDAAARVPVQKPSQSVRPGSLRCTCALDAREAGWADGRQSRETDVLDESREEILVADVYYPASLVACGVRSDVSSFPGIDYFPCLGGD